MSEIRMPIAVIGAKRGRDVALKILPENFAHEAILCAQRINLILAGAR